MGVHDSGIQAVQNVKFPQLSADGRGSHRLAAAAGKQGAFVSAGFLQPGKGIGLQARGNIDPPRPAAFGRDVGVSAAGVGNRKKHQFADPHAGGGHIADDEIVQAVSVPEQALLQVFIIRLTDDVLQKRLLLDPQHGQPLLSHAQKFQVAVDGADPQIDGSGFVAFQQKAFVQTERLRSDR